MKKHKIIWTNHTWNPVTGCNPISNGCQSCYAAAMANRLKGRCGYHAVDPFRITLRPERLEIPITWRGPGFVFVCSMGDFLHRDVPTDYIMEMLAVMKGADHLIFQFLTKRTDRLLELQLGIDWPANVWMGVTVESEEYMSRIDALRRTTAPIKFLSLEPLLGPLPGLDLTGIDWVIVGGETGPSPRPIQPSWVREIRDNCQETNTPFLFKSWDEKPAIKEIIKHA